MVVLRIPEFRYHFVAFFHIFLANSNQGKYNFPQCSLRISEICFTAVATIFAGNLMAVLK